MRLVVGGTYIRCLFNVASFMVYGKTKIGGECLKGNIWSDKSSHKGREAAFTKGEVLTN